MFHKIIEEQMATLEKLTKSSFSREADEEAEIDEGNGAEEEAEADENIRDKEIEADSVRDAMEDSK